MGYLVAVILFGIGGYVHYQSRTWTKPEVLFCYEFGIISLLASFRLYGLYPAGTLTWIIILIGTISFVVGCSIGKHLKISGMQSECDTVYPSQLMSDSVFWMLVAIITVYMFSDFLQSLRYMRTGISLGDIRNASVGLESIDGYTRRTGALWEYIGLGISELELFVGAVGIVKFLQDIRGNYRFIIGVLFIEILRSLTYGGRFGLAYIIIELLVGMSLSRLIQGRGIQLSMKVKRRIRTIVLLLIGMIVFITIIRGAETNEILKKYYRYICGDVIFFDLHVKRMSLDSFWAIGYAGFYGFWAVILPILNSLGISYPQAYLTTVSTVMDGQTFMRIGDGLVTNAFITPFYHLYADFRLLGVILGMMAFGIIAGYLYKKALQRKDVYSLACYLIIAQMIFKSLQTYPFASKTYAVALIIIWLVGNRWKIGFKRKI